MANLNFNSLLEGTQVTLNLSNQNMINSVNNAVNMNLAKIKKAAKVQRPKMIMRIITEAVPGIIWSENGNVFSATHPSDIVKNVRAGKTVYQFDKNGNLVNSYPSVQEAHRKTGISDASICYCANNKYGFKTAGGYKWSYREAI